jgi:hypothetical protein
MQTEDATLWGSLVALLVTLGGLLAKRLKSAKRIMPRGRIRFTFSLRTPETMPPPEIEFLPPAAPAPVRRATPFDEDLETPTDRPPPPRRTRQ